MGHARTFRDSYIRMRTALLLSAAALPIAMLTTPVEAQQITSGVRGTITGPDGAPVTNAQVTVADTRTGRTTTATTGGQGGFSISGLEIGGPYIVTITSASYRSQRVEDLFLSLSDTADISVQLEAAGGAMEEIVVTAAAVTTHLAIGPSSAFGLESLENLPSISRDIRDTIRMDPRVNIDATNDDNISCLGGNNRFNSFTIDGVRTNDGFGLNASGFPARNTMPIPFDAVRETSVEFSPFDVQYGQFTGCSINVVTKTGENEFHGSAFGVHTNENFIGKTIDGNTVIEDFETFKDWNWGADLGGPIIKDKLFFYVAYEETKDTRIQNEGPIGAGFANETFLTLADAQLIQNILETTYGQDTGGIVRSLPEESRRILARIDWYLSDQHRVALTYTRMRELFMEEDDFGFNGFAFRNNFENSGSEVETYSARLFSDWTDNFSTELRISRLDNHDIQNPVGGGEAQDANPIPRFIIQDGFGDDIAISGPGFFRSANSLITQIDQIKATAEYRMGSHTFTAGYELDQLDVFNLFIPASTGTIEFASIADLAAGQADFMFAIGPFSNNILDAAADYKRSIHSLYVQDEWQATDALTVTAGLRYDFFKSSDKPPLQPNFVARYGFENTRGFGGLDVLQPRLGFNYETPWKLKGDTTLRGGVGVFTGGDPTVWFSNAFSNFGGANAFGHVFSAQCGFGAANDLLASGSFQGFPQCVFDRAQELALAGEGPVDAIDPNFKLPSVVRASLGFTHYTDFGGGFFDDWTVNFDIIKTWRRNAPDFIDLTLSQVGVAPDGRPIFDRIDPLRAGCNATFLGPRQGFSIPAGEEAACADSRSDQDSLLTNVVGNDGGATSVSIQFAKTFEFDTARPTSLTFNFGYAYTDAKDRNPTTSSTAGSNIEEVALSVVNSAPLGPSPFANKHSVRLAAIFQKDFFEDLTTTVGLFFQARSGRPFSYVWDDDTTEDLFGDSDDEARQLIYVPTGPGDPLVDFSNLTTAEVDAFFAFIDNSGLSKYAGGIAPRNAFNDPWFKDLDLRLSQDIPTPWDGHKLTIFADFENFLNLIDDGANILKSYDRGDVAEGVPIAAADLVGGRYQYTFAGGAALQSSVSPSVWAIQFGVRYKF